MMTTHWKTLDWWYDQAQARPGRRCPHCGGWAWGQYHITKWGGKELSDGCAMCGWQEVLLVQERPTEPPEVPQVWTVLPDPPEWGRWKRYTEKRRLKREEARHAQRVSDV